MRDFVDEVACLSWCVKVVHAFRYGQMFVAVAGVEIIVLLEGSMGGCDGGIAGERRRLSLCGLKAVS